MNSQPKHILVDNTSIDRVVIEGDFSDNQVNTNSSYLKVRVRDAGYGDTTKVTTKDKRYKQNLAITEWEALFENLLLNHIDFIVNFIL